MKQPTKHVYSRNIFLIGFMGSGKSAISDYLSERYGMEKIEMDDQIAREEGMSISEIFDTRGEEYFRNLESSLLVRLGDKKNVVVSCGGGTPMRDNNVRLMKQHGTVVWLTASPETIYERVKDSEDRPLLKGHKNTAYISQLMQQRRPRYEAAADLTIETDGKERAAICEELLQKLMESEKILTIRKLTIRNLTIGEGIPKICVPLTGITQEEIFMQAKQLAQLPADIAEWRADWFAKAQEPKAVADTLKKLREILGELPLLFTFRTKKEGGQADVGQEEYLALNQTVIRSETADLIDVELFTGEHSVRQLIEEAHRYGVKVLASNHDFEKTPPKEEIIRRMRSMQQLDADILKIAVMPQCRADVLTLLAATQEMDERYAKRPIVTMSMGAQGVISRLCGEFSGSAITFGTAGRASAPGQMPVKELAGILARIHSSMS